jgi:hypothetical protein
MGFSKYARASIVQPAINRNGWDEIRQQAKALGPTFETRTASHVVLEEYDPKKYLLSHCSIIASVDTEQVAHPLGKHLVDGVQIDRKYADYFITPDTIKYVNNNNDAWERKLLLACFKTFVGGENYVEHIQIPELSKGKIIDAAARDIGDSIYVDILVATEKKHKALIDAILKEEISTLSMGAQVAFTICTKCGNVAEDELQLCRHIKYQKGNYFLDEMGRRRKIAELCGHITAEPGSVKFIEASWVANPAFTGAVLRNVLDPATASVPQGTTQKLQVALKQPARTADPNALAKAAALAPVGVGAKAVVADHLPYLYDGEPLSYLHAPPPHSALGKAYAKKQERLSQLKSAQGQQGIDDFSQEDAAPAKGKDEDSLNKTVDDLHKKVVEKVVDKVKEDLDKAEGDDVREVLDENSSNESLIKSALKSASWRRTAAYVAKSVGEPRVARKLFAGLVLFKAGGWKRVASSKSFSGKEILAVSRLLDSFTRKSSMAGQARIYRTVLAVGGVSPYANASDYLAACRDVIGRDLTESEKVELLFKGELYSLGH